MNRRRSRRIAITAAVLPLVVLVGLRSAWAAYACGLDGRVRSECCCPRPHEGEPPGDGVRIEARDCCDVTVGESATAPAARETTGAFEHAVPVFVIAETPALVAVARTVLLPPRALARPPPPVPTYLTNRSILR